MPIIEKLVVILVFGALSCSCSSKEYVEPTLFTKFQLDRDLYLAHFDSKTDVDDIHSVAAVATVLADPRFSQVNYHAVAGAYGIQDGLYVPANELFELVFEERWSDAHTDFGVALGEVSGLAIRTLNSEGAIWIADAGQSDFSAALIRSIQALLPEVDVKSRIHIVQHSEWNEEVTSPEDLAFTKEAASYHKIPDGNVVGNGTPGFRSDVIVNWQEHIVDARLTEVWKTAIGIANTYNGADGRYVNESIQKGGLDFSDVAETAWIFGFDDLVDANDFFQEFSNLKRK